MLDKQSDFNATELIVIRLVSYDNASNVKLFVLDAYGWSSIDLKLAGRVNVLINPSIHVTLGAKHNDNEWFHAGIPMIAPRRRSP